MGAGCSSSNSEATGVRRSSVSSHHQENIKNRLNPTEKVEKWKEKMLLDIGSDPLSVIRDFPRMNVFVIHDEEEKRNLTRGGAYVNYTIKDGEEEGHDDMGRVSDVDSAERAASARHRERLDTGLAMVPMDGSRSRSRSSSRAAKGERRRQKKGPSESMNASARYAAERSTGRPPASNPLTPTTQGIHNGPFANSLSSVSGVGKYRMTIDEQDREQRRFAARRRQLRATVLAIADLVGESDTFGRAFDTAWAARVAEFYTDDPPSSNPHPKSAGAGGGSRPPSASYCQESAPSAAAVGEGSRRRSSSTGGGGGPTSTSQAYAKVTDIHQLFQMVCIDCGMLQVAPPTTVTLEPEGAGNTGWSHVRSSKAGSRVSSTIMTPEASCLALDRPNQTTTSATVNASGTKPEYLVCSATFHVMQYMVQGVMFFPTQRLKHLLWFPWSPNSLFTDVDWKIFVYLEKNVKSISTFVYEKKLTQTAHKRGMENANGKHVGLNSRLSASEADHPTETSQLLAHRRESSGLNGGRQQYNSTGPSRDLLVIKHLQIVQHYVDESDVKVIPRYELDWTCAIYADRDILTSAYANSAKATSSTPPGDVDSEVDDHGRAREDHSPQSGLATAVSGARSPSPAAPGALRSSLMHAGDEGGLGGRTTDPFDTASPTAASAVEVISGVRPSQQPRLVSAEVVFANINVVAARVEAARRGLCGVPSAWSKNTGELRYLLGEQYAVDLDEVREMRRSRY